MADLIQTLAKLDSKRVQIVLNSSEHFSFSQALDSLAGSGALSVLDTLNDDKSMLKRMQRLGDDVFKLEVTSPDDQRVAVVIQPTDSAPAVSEETAHQIAALVNRRFFLDINMEDVRDTLNVNTYGKEIIELCWPVRPVNYGGAWEALLKSIVHAQIFPGLAKQLDDALRMNYGERVEFDEELVPMLPRPVELVRANEETLRDMRFSRQKASYLTTIADTLLEEESTYDFERLRKLPGDEAVATLRELKGVGAWTSQNVAMRGLPHTDVFIDEKTTRATLAPYYGDRDDSISKKQVKEAAAEFAPFRSFACYYTYMKHFNM